jgi:hypothetical protein
LRTFGEEQTPQSLPRDSRLVNMASGWRLRSSYGNYLWFLRRLLWLAVAVESELQVKSRGGISFSERRRRGSRANRARGSGIHVLPSRARKILADRSSNVPFFVSESNHHDSFFPPAADSGTRHSARDIIETCRCRSLYIRFCYFVPKSTSYHLYTF